MVRPHVGLSYARTLGNHRRRASWTAKCANAHPDFATKPTNNGTKSGATAATQLSEQYRIDQRKVRGEHAEGRA